MDRRRGLERSQEVPHKALKVVPEEPWLTLITGGRNLSYLLFEQPQHPPTGAPGQHIHPTQYWGTQPGEDWESGFPVMPKAQGSFRYQLVLTDTFLGWVEAFATQTETALEVSKTFLKEIIPRFGLPKR